MSITRAAFRRNLGLRTGQPFFRKFGIDAQAPSATGTTTTLIDTAYLKDEDNAWNGNFVYLPPTDEVREISDFDQGTSTLTWLAPMTAAPDANDTYEIWSQFTPLEVNLALNYALASAWPFFYLAARDETTCIEDADGLYYTLPTTNTIRRLCQVYLKIYDSIVGTVTTVGGAATQLTDANASFTSADVGKYVSIYKGGGAANGEVRIVTAYVSATELTTAAFSANPAEDAKYRLLDLSTVNPQQVMLSNWALDRPEFPTEMWLGQHPSGFEGYPICYLYEYEHPPLTTETGSTTCPVEFLYSAAAAYLYFMKLASSPVTEVPAWEALHKAASGSAQLYARVHAQTHMPTQIIRHDNAGFGVPADYPFR
jgi:hypothetical protein